MLEISEEFSTHLVDGEETAFVFVKDLDQFSLGKKEEAIQVSEPPGSKDDATQDTPELIQEKDEDIQEQNFQIANGERKWAALVHSVAFFLPLPVVPPREPSYQLQITMSPLLTCFGVPI